MECQEYKSTLYLYVSGELDKNRHKKFETHLKKCKLCQNGVAIVQNIQKNYQALPPVEKTLSSFLPLLKRSKQKRIIYGKFKFKARVWVPAAAALVLAFLYISYAHFFPKNPIHIFDIPSLQFKEQTNSEFKLVSNINDQNDNLKQIQGLVSELNKPSGKVSFTFEPDQQIQTIQSKIQNLKNEPIF